MATTPKTYSADSADPQFLNQMAQMIAGDMGSNTPFKVTGPQAQTVLDLAKQQNQQDMGATSPGFGTIVLPSNMPNDAITQELKKNVASANQPIGQWFQSNFANYSLIVLGIVLGVGALLISQKETIIQVGKSAGKAAELIG